MAAGQYARKATKPGRDLHTMEDSRIHRLWDAIDVAPHLPAAATPCDSHRQSFAEAAQRACLGKRRWA